MKKSLVAQSVFRLTNQLIRNTDEIIAPYGLTGHQARIIGFLSKNSNRKIYQKDIEEEWNIRKSSVSSVLQNLENNGFIIRVSDESDSRLKSIILLDKGKEVDELVSKKIEEVDLKMRKALSEEELQQFFFLITKLTKSISD